MTGFRYHVILAVLVMSLDAAMGIAQQDLLALDAAQVFLVAFLHAQVTRVVAALVVVVELYLLGGHLAYIS